MMQLKIMALSFDYLSLLIIDFNFNLFNLLRNFLLRGGINWHHFFECAT